MKENLKLTTFFLLYSNYFIAFKKNYSISDIRSNEATPSALSYSGMGANQSPISTQSSHFISRPPSNLGEYDFRLSENFNSNDRDYSDSLIDFNDFSLTYEPPEPFKIPKIDPYITSNMDPDNTITLQELYLAHCRALINSLKDMHFKEFFDTISTTFSGVSFPVQQLLKEDSICQWIHRCDWAMYKVCTIFTIITFGCFFSTKKCK